MTGQQAWAEAFVPDEVAVASLRTKRRTICGLRPGNQIGIKRGTLRSQAGNLGNGNDSCVSCWFARPLPRWTDFHLVKPGSALALPLYGTILKLVLRCCDNNRTWIQSCLTQCFVNKLPPFYVPWSSERRLKLS